MTILQVNCFWRHGSTGSLVASLRDGLTASGERALVAYGRRRRPPEPGVCKLSPEWEGKLSALLSRLLGEDLGHAPVATRRLLRLLRRERPDVVHLHCLNGHTVNVYRLLEALKKQRIPTVLTLHAELMHTAGCEHALDCTRWESARGCADCPRIRGALSALWRDNAAHAYRKMREALAGFETLTVVAVSPWLAERAARAPLLAGHPVLTVENGVDTALFRPRTGEERAALRQRLGLRPGERVILHVTPRFSASIKGGEAVLALAARLGVAPPPGGCRVVVVGFDALPAGWTEDLPASLLPLAHTSDREELATLYALADLTVLTSRRETFSLVLAESLCAGTPVVGYAAGGPESIALPGCARFVSQGDLDALEAAVRATLARTWDATSVAAAAAERYAATRMVADYRRLYAALVAEPEGDTTLSHMEVKL